VVTVAFTLVVIKAAVTGGDDIPAEHVDAIAGQLAVALRGAADVTQAGNYDVTIHFDGSITTEREVRESTGLSYGKGRP
jgi:hypothetical protein